MINNFIKTQLVPCLLTLSLVATSFGGAFASSVSAASVDSEEAVEDSSSGTAILAGLAAVGLIAALSHHGGSDKDSGSSKNVGSSSGSSGSNSGSSSGSNSSSSPSNGSSSEVQQAVTLLNQDRTANGLSTLKVNSQLTNLAQNYALDMATRGFFSHNNPEGQTPFDRMKQAGISYKYAGENLAINTSVPAAEVAFMNSSGHRANILNGNYTDVGVGVVHSKGSVYVVQEFIGK
ncbi:MAG TPA: CAP domain-containing protein [Selenomonadales bacterium]|nr:CAP domain-containing protein [Selenomonadales bacterium]